MKKMMYGETTSTLIKEEYIETIHSRTDEDDERMEFEIQKSNAPQAKLHEKMEDL